jgi:cytochrome c553
MARTLSDEDINAVAARIVSMIGERPATKSPEPVQTSRFSPSFNSRL